MKFEYLEKVKKEHIHLFQKKNEPFAVSNGIFIRYKNSVITADHIPLHWRYDLNPASNPFEMERIGVNVAFNSGAIKWKDKYILCVRVEGNGRKSFLPLPKVRME